MYCYFESTRRMITIFVSLAQVYTCGPQSLVWSKKLHMGYIGMQEVSILNKPLDLNLTLWQTCKVVRPWAFFHETTVLFSPSYSSTKSNLIILLT